MKLLFAQGNPEKDYTATRHNVGFFILDQYARNHDVTFSLKNKFHAEIAEVTVNNEKVILAKPTTYYNETGRSARLLVDFYKLNPAEDFLVVHDDLALPFGTIRTREKGSSAGNNGIKSLNTSLGEDYKRLRIGIYNPLRDRIPDTDFVLAKFTENEKNALADIYRLAAGFIDDFVIGSFESTKRSITRPEA
jgi:peptidyl-tRNA hydrolase, PTH1 family